MGPPLTCPSADAFEVRTSRTTTGRATDSTLYVYGVKKWSTSTSYTGDSTATTALEGGSAVRAITDVFGNTVERRTYAGTTPADAAYGAGIGITYTSVKYTNTLDGKPSTVTGPDDTKWSYGYDLFGRTTTTTDPDLGTSTTTYTDLDQTSTTADSRGKILLYAYDVLGRKTDQWQTSRTDTDKLAHWDYDTLAKGQLDDSVSYVGGTTGSSYTRKVTAYDSLYHATGTRLTLPSDDPLVTSGALSSATLDFSSYYNINGTQQYYKEPAAGGLNSEIVDYEYDGLGLVTDVGGATGYLLDVDYNQLGQAGQYALGTSADTTTSKHVYVTNTYEEGTDRLTRSLTTDATRAVQDLNYTYDDTGQVTSTFDTANLSGTGKTDYQCFAYDGYQRLTEAWTPSTVDCSATGRTTTNLGGASPYWTSYTYTSSGLRTMETDHTSTGDSSRTYCYDTTHPHQLTATTTAASCTGVDADYAYDSTGNTTTRPNNTDTQTLTWTATGDLDTITEKTDTGTTKSTTSHVYDADGNLLIRRNTGGETVLYLGTSGTQTLSYLSGDPHGTSTVSLDATTQAVTKRYLTPFGATRTGTVGVWPDDKAFLGKTTDTDTGRFISVDPVLATGDAQSLNGYTYANNNPVTVADPSGACADIDCPTRPGPDYENTTPGHTPGKAKKSQNMKAAASHSGTASSASPGVASSGRYGNKTTAHDLPRDRAIVEIKKQAKEMGVSNFQIITNLRVPGASKKCMRPGMYPGADCNYGVPDIVGIDVDHDIYYVWEVKSEGAGQSHRLL